jgi:hypothetical protein
MRRVFAAGVPLALLCLTRPDGPLFAVIACGFVFLQSRSSKGARTAIALGAFPAAAVLGQLAFRLIYYGDWVPNTARAKVALTGARVESGMACVTDAGAASYALWVPALFAFYVAWREPTRRPPILLTAAFAAGWTLYAATVICAPYGFRMLIPTFVLAAFLLSEALDWAQRQGKMAKALGWGGSCVLLVLFGWSQHTEPSIVLARTQRPPVTVMASTIGTTLGEAFAEDDPLLAVDAAGAIPFYSRLRSLDMLGLNDAHIARQRDDRFGEGTQGHELGDGAYVLSREPDLIVAKRLGNNRLAFAGGAEMASNAEFSKSYRLVRARGERPVPRVFFVFVRLEGRVGIRRSDDLVSIPGYLFANRRGTAATLDDADELSAELLHGLEVTLEQIELPAGTWRLTWRGRGPFRLSARTHEQGIHSDRVPRGVELSLTKPSAIDISIVGERGSRLSEVVARRVADEAEGR